LQTDQKQEINFVWPYLTSNCCSALFLELLMNLECYIAQMGPSIVL